MSRIAKVTNQAQPVEVRNMAKGAPFSTGGPDQRVLFRPLPFDARIQLQTDYLNHVICLCLGDDEGPYITALHETTLVYPLRVVEPAAFTNQIQA